MRKSANQLLLPSDTLGSRNISCHLASKPCVTKVSRRPHSFEHEKKPLNDRITTVIRVSVRSPVITPLNEYYPTNDDNNMNTMSTIITMPDEGIKLYESLPILDKIARLQGARRPVIVSRISRRDLPRPALIRTIENNNFANEDNQQRMNSQEELPGNISCSSECGTTLPLIVKQHPPRLLEKNNDRVLKIAGAESKRRPQRGRVTPTNMGSDITRFSNQGQPDTKRKKKKNRRRLALAFCPCSCAICSLLVGLVLVTALAVTLGIILSRNSSKTVSITTPATTVVTGSTIVTTDSTTITTQITNNEVTTEEITSTSATTVTTDSTTVITDSTTVTTASTTAPTTSTTVSTASTTVSTASTTVSTISTTVTTQTTTLCPPIGIVNFQSYSGAMGSWVQRKFNYTATKTTPTLVFTTTNTNRIFYLDSVSVVDVDNSSIELLNNPGFDSSSTTLSDWSLWCTSSCGGSGGQLISSGCLSGNCYQNSCSGTADYLLQSFTAVIGRVYTISFWLNRSGSGGAIGSFSIGVF